MFEKHLKGLIISLGTAGIFFSNILQANLNTNYFPLEIGNEWHYSLGDSNKIELTNIISDTIQIADKQYFIFHDNAVVTWLSPSIDTLRADEDGNIWQYSYGKEQKLFDFTLPKDSTYQYIQYQKNQIDTFFVKISKHSSVNILLKNYEDCVQFQFDKPDSFLVGDEFNYYFAPNIGLITKRYMGSPESVLELISAKIDNQYTTNRIKFFPKCDSVFVSAGCSLPLMVMGVKSQINSIDSLNIITPYNNFEYYNSPNSEKCGFLVYDPTDELDYEFWYDPIICRYDTLKHIIPFDAENPYLGIFNITAKAFRNKIVVDSLSQIFRAREYLATKDEIPPHSFHLSQNYPNPFNPTTTIVYALPKKSQVKISVYDISGRLVETLVNNEKPSGTHQVVWNAGNYASGVYFYKIETGSLVDFRKCLLMK